MEFLDVSVEEATIHRVLIPNDEVRAVLDEMGFEEHGGEMAIYRERYADADRILQVIEERDLETELEENLLIALGAIKELAESIADGTICFYEA